MNIPMSWLKQYVEINVNTNEFVEAMTMSGTKVEAVVKLADEIDKVVVGKIISIVKHPEADKLVICKVDVGQNEPIQIVTGAKNIFEGAVIPVALDGSTISGGKKINKGVLRGEESNGMLCSIDELGYTRTDFPEAPEDGIYIFDHEHELGSDACKVLELKDEVVEFEITSNRSDCYSVYGIAREVAATFDKPLSHPLMKLEEAAGGRASDLIEIEIKNAELCPRYIARLVKNVKIEPSPQWMRRRLSSAGIRPINNIVDITNYVMLEIGQPMHAFDVDNITNRKIIVRNAEAGEQFTTLDGVVRTLDESMLVIADCEKAVGIAGVMGGQNSKITENVSAILFESATFKGVNIRQTAKKLGLRTDASSKFEKGLDPNIAMIAVNRAVQLVEELKCGEVVCGFVDCYPNVREEVTVEYNTDRINALIGTKLTCGEISDLLRRAEIIAENGKATVPTFRPDVQMEADLAEEVARLYGYDKIEPTLVVGTPTVGRLNHKQTLEDLVKNTMVAFGYCESMNYSFESPKVLDILNLEKNNPLRKTVKIINPLGEDFSIMRTVTVNGMLNSLSTNYNRRNDEAKLFEVGKVYLPKQLPMRELPIETNVLTLGMYGNFDFYDMKGAVEGLLDALGIKNADFCVEDGISYMHPGRTASIKIGETELGYVGEVHPETLSRYEIGTKAYLAVVNLDEAFAAASLRREYKPLPKFPGIMRDIAILLPENILARDIEQVIREHAGKLLEDVKLFDVYKGKQVGEGFKSVAYKIFFRANERTLTDDEVNKAIGKVLDKLKEKLNATLRS